MENKIVIIGILVIGIMLINGCMGRTEGKLLIEDFEQVNVYEDGRKVSLNETKGMREILVSILKRLNLQAKCIFSEEKIKEIKRNDKVLEVIFTVPINITIFQWVKPEDRNYIKTDVNGYRVLENVKIALFIMKDNLNEALEGSILLGYETEGKVDRYECWAIQRQESKEVDKSWIDEVNKILTKS